MDYQELDYDIVIIGAGGAGLRAAIEATANERVKVAIVCKSLLGKAHTVMAEGGMAAALANMEGQDSWEVHFRDTMKGGKFLNNWKMAEIHAKEAPERVRELERFGAVFDRTEDGNIHQRPFGGHSFARLAHVGDRTGLEMIRTLQDVVVHRGAEVFMEYTVVKIFTEDGEVRGLLAYNRNDGKFLAISCRCLIVATGGCGRCFEVQTNSWEGTGDGHALAYEAGAELMDMEFMQFHPTGMVWPLSVRGILVTEGVRGEGGVLRNGKGERFMFNYIPEAFKNDVADNEKEAAAWVAGDFANNRRPPELLTRDVVARAILAEIEAGRASEHGGVYLDISSQRGADYIKQKLPSMYHQFKELGDVDITKEPMEVGPTAHYIMGGVRVEAESCESTTVKGLFAAGEVASGLHGANRLGGNSLTDLLVFGKRAGEFAVKRALTSSEKKGLSNELVQEEISKAREPMNKDGGINPFELEAELKQIMAGHCSIIRNGGKLEVGLKKLDELEEKIGEVAVGPGMNLNTAWHCALSLRSLMIVARALAMAALARRESRGAHTRDDYPDYDREFGGKNLILYKDNGRMRLKGEALPEMPMSYQQLIEKYEKDV